ncbi:MAG: hypothetical protein ACJ73J_09705, partial [Actinomycetes bacterium]
DVAGVRHEPRGHQVLPLIWGYGHVVVVPRLRGDELHPVFGEIDNTRRDAEEFSTPQGPIEWE